MNGTRKKIHPEIGNSDQERQTYAYVFTYKWILAVK